MATNNKKSFASKALLEMDDITSAIKEESKKSLSSFLNEAVKNALRESCNGEDCDEDKDYEIQDGDSDENKNDEKKKADSKKNSKKSTNEDGEDPRMNGQNGENDMGNQMPSQNPNPQMGGNQEMGPEEAPEEMQGQEMDGQEPEMGEMDGQDVDGEQNGEEGNESWNEFEKYKVGDNTYDLTGENDYDSVVKVYKLLNDEDQVVVKKDDNILHISDNEAGTEYVIDLGGDDEQDVPSEESMGGEEEMPDELNEGLFSEDDDFDMAGTPGYDEFDDDEFEDDEHPDEFDGGFSNEFDEFEDDEYPEDYLESDEFEDEEYPEDGLESHEFDEFDDIYENKRNKRKPMMKESKNVLFEIDLGYTDNYQDKDPIAGLSNNEPAKGKKSWHKGVPTGTSKPWAGQSKTKGDPFKETKKVEGSVNEEDMGDMGGMEEPVEESAMSNSSQSARKKTKTKPSNGRKDYLPNVTKSVSTAESGYEAEKSLKESKELKAIKNENKELKKAIVELRKNLNEAYITNVNLGKIAKLFLENTTSQKEKIEIVNRFSNEAKTVKQSEALYESINKQLKKANKSINLNESSQTANGTKALNEEKLYKSDSLLKTIDFMNRVLSC